MVKKKTTAKAVAPEAEAPEASLAAGIEPRPTDDLMEALQTVLNTTGGSLVINSEESDDDFTVSLSFYDPKVKGKLSYGQGRDRLLPHAMEQALRMANL